MLEYSFIDNGTLGYLTRPGNERFFDRFVSDIKANSLPQLLADRTVVTPFSMIEAIGYARRTIPKNTKISPDPTLLTNLERAVRCQQVPEQARLIEAIKYDLYEQFYAFYRAAPGFQLSDFQTKLAKQMDKHCSDGGRRIYEALFLHNLNRSDAVGVVHRRFAIDRVYNFTFPESVRELFETSAIADVFRGVESGPEITQYRAILRIWYRFSNHILNHKSRRRFGMADHELSAYLKRIHTEVAAGAHDDFLDTELYHYAIVGKRQERQRMPVYCYTSDRFEQIRVRLAFYKSMFLSFQTLVEKCMPEIPPVYGKVIRVGSDGSILEIVDAETIDPILKDANTLQLVTAHFKQALYLYRKPRLSRNNILNKIRRRFG